MKSVKLFAIVFLMMTVAISCTKDDDTDIMDKTEQSTGSNNNATGDNGGNAQDPAGAEQPKGNSGSNNGGQEALTGSNTLTGAIELYHDQIKLGKGASATVQLLNSQKQVLATTTSDANGSYTFKNVPQGTYSIYVKKDGYFNKGYLDPKDIDRNAPKYTFAQDNNMTITADVYKIYKKATNKVTAVKWYQSTNNDGVHMDITFDGLDIPAEENYIYIYVFAGNNKNVTKDNYLTTLSNSTRKGYVKAYIPKNKIVNNQIKDFRVTDFCGWRGNFGVWNINPLPTHYAFYVTTTINTYDRFAECGNDYSGIGDKYLVVGDGGSSVY